MMVTDTGLDRKIDANYHLGHIIFECFKTRKPDDICQIDAATGEEETYGSVLTRSLAMAKSFRNAGLQPGDVVALAGRNHLNLRIPYYAALMNGLPVAGIDPDYKYDELKKSLGIVLPKIAFCEKENYELYSRVVQELDLHTKIVTFSDGDYSMTKFVEKFDNHKIEFSPSCFDTDKVYAFLISTSGTTGGVKFAAIKHDAAVVAVKTLLKITGANSTNPQCQKTMVNMSTVHWVASYYINIAWHIAHRTSHIAHPLVNIRILQVPRMVTSVLVDMINTYKPSIIISTPAISLILKQDKHCDFSCFDVFIIGGAKVFKEMLLKLKALTRKDTKVMEAYGQTETYPGVLCATGKEPLGSCGSATDIHQLKLMDVDSKTEITAPYKQGELWIKGTARFTEYYNNPEDTKNTITEDGWFKTGDILYRDEHGNYYFVERLKMLIKYRITHVIPTELEEVLEKHPGVLETCVTSIPHEEDGERPVACVVRRPGCHVTAQELKDLIADKLSGPKQLRGGVIFMESLPKTSSGKISRAKVKEMVGTMTRE